VKEAIESGGIDARGVTSIREWSVSGRGSTNTGVILGEGSAVCSTSFSSFVSTDILVLLKMKLLGDSRCGVGEGSLPSVFKNENESSLSSAVSGERLRLSPGILRNVSSNATVLEEQFEKLTIINLKV
jgi:hypothetical protein